MTQITRMIDIVYLVWNRNEFTKLSLGSLDKYMDWDAIGKFLVLDDYSSDGAWETCVAWAANKPKARVVHMANPSMRTGYPFCVGAELCGGQRPTVILPNDCYLCSDFFGQFAEFAVAHYDVVSNRQLSRVAHDMDTAAVLSTKRVLEKSRKVTGGVMSMSPRIARAIKPVLMKRDLNLFSLFNTALPEAGVPCAIARPNPPFPILFLDEDVGAGPLTDQLFEREGLPVGRLLELTAKYAEAGWARKVADVETGKVASATLVPDTKQKRWV